MDGMISERKQQQNFFIWNQENVHWLKSEVLIVHFLTASEHKSTVIILIEIFTWKAILEIVLCRVLQYYC